MPTLPCPDCPAAVPVAAWRAPAAHDQLRRQALATERARERRAVVRARKARLQRLGPPA